MFINEFTMNVIFQPRYSSLGGIFFILRSMNKKIFYSSLQGVLY
uniref:Uncharacterized protein n=1 Tax=Anguilla anguilla TaxID=7936 RepID=A0A0E9XNE7_ANGAN